ncbi:uncharacterized protein PG986_011762 [Apiospora aurea]|uniref:Uncharacterized protein n=1 Tax=Apiospora aurea TaxID=335848 RepID=A0ABR1PY18_9PEZI
MVTFLRSSSPSLGKITYHIQYTIMATTEHVEYPEPEGETSAGETAGETTGETTGETAGETSAGETSAGETAGDTTGETTGDTVGNRETTVTVTPLEDIKDDEPPFLGISTIPPSPVTAKTP